MSVHLQLLGCSDIKIHKIGTNNHNGLRKNIAKFEETGSFDVERGRGRKLVSAAAVEDVATAFQEQTSSYNEISSARKMPNAGYADQHDT